MFSFKTIIHYSIILLLYPSIQYYFLLVNLTQSDADSIRLYIKDPRLFEECKKLIAEIKKGRINQPGKFLLKKLRECQEVINKQNLKLK